MRDRLSPEERPGRAQAAAAPLAAAFPNPAEDHRTWPKSARLLPDVLAAAQHPEAAGTDLADVLNGAGIYLSSRARIQRRATRWKERCG